MKKEKNLLKRKENFSFKKNFVESKKKKEGKNENQGSVKKRKMRVKCWNCFWNEEGTLDCDIKILFFSLLFLISSAISMLSFILLFFFSFKNAKVSLAYFFSFLISFVFIHSLRGVSEKGEIKINFMKNMAYLLCVL